MFGGNTRMKENSSSDKTNVSGADKNKNPSSKPVYLDEPLTEYDF